MRPVLRFFLDEGVPVSVGDTMIAASHEVIRLQAALPPGSPDPLVCAAAEKNDAILVAFDGDMKALARRRGIGRARFKKLSLLKLSCRETRAALRVQSAMSLIEHEWNFGQANLDRRTFIEIGNDVIRTVR